MSIDEPLNAFDETLEPCSEDPLTGFFRDGCCNTNLQDLGVHTICVEVTQEFIEFSRFRGNDLSTPQPQLGFPSLNRGDRGCLCAARWLEAYEHDIAPRVFLRSTHRRTLDLIPLELLRRFATDLN